MRLLLLFAFIPELTSAQWTLKLSSNVEIRTWKLTTKADKDERPLGGASIVLAKANGQVVTQTASDGNGDFSVDVPPNDEFVLTVSYQSCNPKRFAINTRNVPEKVANDNFHPTYSIGGFIMAKAFPGIDYSGLKESLVRVIYFDKGQKFDDDEPATDRGISIVSKISEAENILIEKFCSTNRAGDAALAKPDCPLAKKLYNEAIALIPGEPYPVEQLKKVGDCLKQIEQEQQKAAAENAAKAKAEADRIAAEKAAKEKAEKEKAEEERIAKERAEQEKIAKQKAEQEKIVKEKAEAEAKQLAEQKKAEEKAAKEKAEKEKAEQEKLAREKTDAEAKQLAEQKKNEEKAAKEKAEKEKAEQEKLAGEKTAAEAKQLAEQKKNEEKAAKEKAEKEKAEQEKLAEQKKTEEKAEKEKEEREKAGQEKLAGEKTDAEKKQPEEKQTALQALVKDKTSDAANDTQKKGSTTVAEQEKKKENSVIKQKELSAEEADAAARRAEKQRKKAEELAKQKEGMERSKAEDEAAMKEDYERSKAKREEKERDREEREEAERKGLLTRHKDGDPEAGHGDNKYSKPQLLGADRYKECMKKGDEYFKTKRYPEAKSWYQEALKAKADDTAAKNKLEQTEKMLSK